MEDKIIIISGGEDEKIKIWDSKFKLKSEINLRNIGI